MRDFFRKFYTNAVFILTTTLDLFRNIIINCNTNPGVIRIDNTFI